jgi:hypothetical protein
MPSGRVLTLQQLTALKLILPGVLKSAVDFIKTLRADIGCLVEKAEHRECNLAKEMLFHCAESKKAKNNADNITMKLDRLFSSKTEVQIDDSTAMSPKTPTTTGEADRRTDAAHEDGKNYRVCGNWLERRRLYI